MIVKYWKQSSLDIQLNILVLSNDLQMGITYLHRIFKPTAVKSFQSVQYVLSEVLSLCSFKFLTRLNLILGSGTIFGILAYSGKPLCQLNLLVVRLYTLKI